ncbi:hypothetical protein INF28_01360 [Oscillospiraceae bacterium DSM 107454]|uniref:Uncharacterized protein n=1 Tax=Ructibacterium gallinarum TaxID=2779355 RepID=A0A9D5R7Q9_9FIRM|nr:hypothetical protein [Ructibacterium gallinarum]
MPQYPKVVLTIPGKENAEAALTCRNTRGRDTDKAAKFNVALNGIAESSIKILDIYSLH